jgi:hypothetical protein
MKKFQITNYADYYSQKELNQIISEMKVNQKLEIIRLPQFELELKEKQQVGE